MKTMRVNRQAAVKIIAAFQARDYIEDKDDLGLAQHLAELYAGKSKPYTDEELVAELHELFELAGEWCRGCAPGIVFDEAGLGFDALAERLGFEW